MPWNPQLHVLVFLPVTLLGFLLLGRLRREAGWAWLVGASLVGYALSPGAVVPVLVGSIVWNYAVARALARQAPEGRLRGATALLGIVVDLAVLAFFKYSAHVPALVAMLGLEGKLGSGALPLGISFFTFTQVAFLVDAWRGETAESRLTRYGLFVSYFPYLVSGPLVRHREMASQWESGSTERPRWENFAVGLTTLSFGLWKKIIVADGIAAYVPSAFGTPERPLAPDFCDAWIGTLAYAAQIYFDFSGYSDMAIGAARLFGPRLPRNFDSPYEATSILDFWRRWHITLSEWFRDYVFMPLSRFFLTRTPLARAPSLAAALAYLTTFTLCGAWHGSSVGFVVWGAYHGLLLGGHRFYNDRLSRRREHPIHRWRRTRAFRLAACAFTFVLVTLGWVFFRAETLSRALVVLEGLFGLNARTPRGPRELAHLVVQCAAILLVLGATWLLPNTDELMRAETAPAGPEATPAPARTPIRWKPTLGWAALVAVLAVVSLLSTKETTSFIYFKF